MGLWVCPETLLPGSRSWRRVVGGAPGASSGRQRPTAGLQHRRRLLGSVLREPQRQPGVGGVHDLPEAEPEPEDGEHVLQRGDLSRRRRRRHSLCRRCRCRRCCRRCSLYSAVKHTTELLINSQYRDRENEQPITQLIVRK